MLWGKIFIRAEPREFSWNDPDINDSNLWFERFCSLQSRCKLNKQNAYQSTAKNSQWVSIVAPDVTSISWPKEISRSKMILETWSFSSSFLTYFTKNIIFCAFDKKFWSLLFPNLVRESEIPFTSMCIALKFV